MLHLHQILCKGNVLTLWCNPDVWTIWITKIASVGLGLEVLGGLSSMYCYDKDRLLSTNPTYGTFLVQHPGNFKLQTVQLLEKEHWSFEPADSMWQPDVESLLHEMSMFTVFQFSYLCQESNLERRDVYRFSHNRIQWPYWPPYGWPNAFQTGFPWS